VELFECRAVELDVGAVAEQSIERVQVERPDGQPLEAIVRQRQFGQSRHVPSLQPAGDQQSDRPFSETAGDELERTRRRSVEPLDIVDRQEDGSALGQRPHDAEEAQRDRARKRRRAFGLPAQQCHLERAPLRLGETRHRFGRDVLQQVAQRGEGELCLRIDRPADEHVIRPRPGAGDDALPQCGLADPRLAFEKEPGGALRGGVEKPSQRVELALSSHDHRFGLRGHRDSSGAWILSPRRQDHGARATRPRICVSRRRR
jgi:hypothetical protein